MQIERDKYDSYYPFIISNSWEQEISCTLADLKELKKQINKILAEEKQKKKLLTNNQTSAII